MIVRLFCFWAMEKKKVSVFIDGFNLYHAVDNLDKPYLKWINPFTLAKEFARKSNGNEIVRVKFFTAFPNHKSKKVQERYSAFTDAVKHYGVEVVEGKFKKKFLTFTDKGKTFIKNSHEEKESDVNIALAILEDAYEKTSDKLLVITNDSDIAPAIRLARIKNPKLIINVITPPLPPGRKANFDLVDACGDVNRNRQGQVFYKTRMIKEIHLERSLMPEEIKLNKGSTILIPKEYKLGRPANV